MERTQVAEVRKILFLNEKTIKDMAADIGVSYGYLRLVLSGKEKGENTVRKVEEYIDHLTRNV